MNSLRQALSWPFMIAAAFLFWIGCKIAGYQFSGEIGRVKS